MIDKTLIATDVSRNYALSQAETDRIVRSLQVNGVAAVRGFVPQGDITQLRGTAEIATTSGFVHGAANAFSTAVIESEGTRDFMHPFLISAVATKIVTNGALLDLVGGFLGDQPIIHHGLFQRSLPLDETLLDWHIDCGSNKRLNGRAKFPDLRLRSILYFGAVESGGLGYILGSAAQARQVFLALPDGRLFPADKIPPDLDRRVTMNEPAGTLVLFDTHGLHRPELPKKERLVMNVWFARKDFSARLPPVLFSLASIPPENRDRISVFDNARGLDGLPLGEVAAPPSIAGRVLSRLLARR